MDSVPGRIGLAAVLDLRRAMLMARSDEHADQYDSASLRWALPILPETQQALVRRVLDKRSRGKTSRITG